MKYERLTEELACIEHEHLYRRLKTVELDAYPYYLVNGQRKLMLASNDYLNFSWHPALKERAAEALGRYPVGSGGARLTTGNSALHEQLEQELARFKGTEAALLFNTGYMANVGVLQALCSPADVVFSDEYNHASIIDGCRLARAEIIVYRHNDMVDLERLIQERQPQRGLLVSDSVFSMDGDLVELPEFLRIAETYGLFSMIDEAHATGVVGATGEGVCEHFALKQKPDIIVGTLSKALGSEGGFVCGRSTLIEYLKNRSRSFIFSTALSPLTIACALAALRLLAEDPEPTRRVQHNAEYLCQELSQRGVAARAESAIIPIAVGDEDRALRVMSRLDAEGLFVSGIRYPTVTKGRAILRCTVASGLREEHLAWAAEKIAEALATV
jgi:6-carboxyhexanoate--CoA ligase